MPDPESGLSRVYGDREIAKPMPPLVAEWLRRSKERAAIASKGETPA